MNGIITSIFNWIDFFIHIYIHITATINAVIFVANKKTTATRRNTAAEIILQRRRSRNNTAVTTARRQQQQRYSHSYYYYNPLVEKKQKKDYFKNIPNEILIVIFEYLDQSDLYNCSTVTKNWNKLSTPILWKSPIPTEPILSCLPLFAIMDKKMNVIHQHQKSHISPSFPIHLARYGYAIKSLDLSQVATHVTDCTIRHIVKCCPHLSSLNLSHCRLITNEALSWLSKLSLKVLVLQNCRQITDTGLSYLQGEQELETLHLGGCHRITDDGIIGLVTSRNGSSIRRINLSDCNRVTGSTLVAIANRCGPRLEWLDMARCTRAIKHTELAWLIQHCPNISRLNVSMKKPKAFSFESRRNQLSLSSTTTQLFDQGREEEEEEETIVVEQQQLTTEEEEEEHPLNELLELLNRFNFQPTLTTGSAQHQQLLIDQHRLKDSVSNQTIELIALNLKKLEYLNLSYWHCLNDKAIQTLSVHSHCLTYLNLIGCSSITRKVLRYLSDLCERKSTCITLTDLMISPTTKKSSYENTGGNWVLTASTSTSSSSSSSSVSSSSCSEKERHTGKMTTTKKKQHSYGVIKSSAATIWA